MTKFVLRLLSPQFVLARGLYDISQVPTQSSGFNAKSEGPVVARPMEIRT